MFLGLGIGDLNPQSIILKKPITNSHHQFAMYHLMVIFTFSSLMENLNGSFDGNFDGNLDGHFEGNLDGNFMEI